MADGKFLDFFDMIDGGGAGQMGDKFEGGGLLSMLGNMLASPYGSQDEERRQRLMKMRGLLDAVGSGSTTGGDFTPPVTHQDPYMEEEMARKRAAAQRMMDMNEPMGGPSPRVQEEIARMRAARRMSQMNEPLGRGRGFISLPNDPQAGGLTAQTSRQLQGSTPLPQDMPQDPASYRGGLNYEIAVGKAIDEIKKIVPNFDSLQGYEKEQLIRGALNNMNMMSGSRP